jgi:hypothetical protein
MDEREMMRRSVEAWREAGPQLDAIRRRKIREADNLQVLAVSIDVSLGGLPFEESMVSRATLFPFGPGLDVRTCSAEDLVVLKLFASRPLDLRAAEGR